MRKEFELNVTNLESVFPQKYADLVEEVRDLEHFAKLKEEKHKLEMAELQGVIKGKKEIVDSFRTYFK